MSKLRLLRRRLAALRRRRSFARWGSALSAILLAVLLVLAALLAADIVFELDVIQRGVVMLIGTAALAWASVRAFKPAWNVRENEIDVALLVERRQTIDSDLTAALQFDRPPATAWGSPQLETAVIDDVAQRERRTDFFAGESWRPLARRVALLAAGAAAAGLAAGAFPEYVRTFSQRLLFGSPHYPTHTVIQRVSVSERVVLRPSPQSTSPDDIALPRGSVLEVLVAAGGTLPTAGRLRLAAAGGGPEKVVDLPRLTSAQIGERGLDRVDPPGDPGSASPEAWYRADAGRLLEPLVYQIDLGDAWTDPARIEPIEPPLVDLELDVVPPAYAGGAAAASRPLSRHFSVLEGSALQVKVTSANGKQLREAWIDVGQGDEQLRLDLQSTDNSGRTWTLDPAGTPLSDVRGEIRFHVQAIDTDDLMLETPLSGFVRLQADRPPQATIDIVHDVVLPTARPVVQYRLQDDYGIARVLLHVAVEPHENEPLVESDDQPAAARQHDVDVLPPATILPASRLPFQGSFPLDLTPFALTKGDRLKLTMEVVDARGAAPGKSFLAEPVTLEVTDEAGVLAAIAESDEQSEQRLDEVIQQQLGIGDSP